MNRCLNERSLLRVYTHEAADAEQSHLRECADCAEHYEQLVEDLGAIGQVLEHPPAALPPRRALPWQLSWAPVALAGAVLIALIFDLSWLRQPSPVLVATRARNVSAFATDLSAALFATSDTNTLPRFGTDSPDLEAALDAGQPCTQERVLAGECNDELSAFLIDSDLN